MKAVQYQLVTGKNRSELEDRVADLLDKGLSFVGGPFFVPSSLGGFFVQAMCLVLVEKKEEP
jgi:hypothetical protein